MNANPDLELAQLSLTGRRYSEAEEKFTRLISTPDAPHAWLGLGLAKIGKLPSRKCTPDEVAFCFNKVFALAPDRKDEACLLALSAAKAMLQEVESLLPEVFAAEDAAAQARVSAFLHKGLSYLRATDNHGSGPSLFTNLDALHDSYRGSVLLDASTEMRSSAQQIRNYLTGAVTNIQVAILLVVPAAFPSRQEWLAAASELIRPLTTSQGVVRVGATARAANPEDYTGIYKSTDQKTVAGICGGIAHKWGWNHSAVQLLFLVGYILTYSILFFIYIYWWITVKKRLPTKGVPKPKKLVA